MKDTSALVNIPVRFLQHHPDNPRKDLGDLSELIESVKANGILQNLSVVPNNHVIWQDRNIWHCKDALELEERISNEAQEGDFYVMIGNRRFEAAVEAGLTEVPCRIIIGLSQADQIAIMLEENLQRNDLTLPEQAYGFQQLIDLGESVGAIIEKTGFSETTIRHRLKIAELDRNTVEEAYNSHQITVGEFSMLETIEDVDVRNEILKNTPDSIAYAVNNYERQKRDAEWKENTLNAVAAVRELKEFPEGERQWSSWWNIVLSVDKGEEPDLSELPEETLYYIIDYCSISFYTLDEDKRAAEESRDAEESQKDEENNIKIKSINALLKEMYGRFRSYVLYLKDKEVDGVATVADVDVLQDIFNTMIAESTYGMRRIIADYLDVEIDEISDYSFCLQMLAYIASNIEGIAVVSYNAMWIEKGAEQVKHILDIFTSLGFEWLNVSEEKEDVQVMQILSGEHALFNKEEE